MNADAWQRRPGAPISTGMIQQIAHLGLLEDEAIILDVAALQLAALDHPEAELDDYTALLQQIADGLQERGKGAKTPREQADALSEILSGGFGFLGDRTTYDDPANADLIRVLDRRRGLPVSLSILYVAAARRLGWEAEALNTPGHVLVRIGHATDAVLIDPFAGGALVGPAQLAGLLAALGEEGPESEHLAPMSNRSVLVRLLLNQATRAEAAGNTARALALYERMTIIAPSNGHGWWQRARLELIEGKIGEARASLSAMLEMTRDPELRTQVTAALEALG